MGHSMGDGVTALAIAAAVIAFFYFRYMEARRRLEIVHQERMVAMEKGIPLPELPLDSQTKKPGDPRAPLLHGVVWTALGFGGVIALFLIPNGVPLWPLPLPLMFLGVGLMLYYALASKHR